MIIWESDKANQPYHEGWRIEKLGRKYNLQRRLPKERAWNHIKGLSCLDSLCNYLYKTFGVPCKASARTEPIKRRNLTNAEKRRGRTPERNLELCLIFLRKKKQEDPDWNDRYHWAEIRNKACSKYGRRAYDAAIKQLAQKARKQPA